MTYCKNTWTDSVLTELVPFVNRLDIYDLSIYLYIISVIRKVHGVMANAGRKYEL